MEKLGKDAKKKFSIRHIDYFYLLAKAGMKCYTVLNRSSCFDLT